LTVKCNRVNFYQFVLGLKSMVRVEVEVKVVRGLTDRRPIADRTVKAALATARAG